jgi:hypothetical protein
MAIVRIYDAKQNKAVTVEKIKKTDAEWKKLLTAEQYEIPPERELRILAPAHSTRSMNPVFSTASVVALTYSVVQPSSIQGPVGPVTMNQSRHSTWHSNLIEVREGCGRRCSAPGAVPISVTFSMMDRSPLANAIA